MTKQIINVGSGELVGDGEGLRSAFIKINNNFNEVYSATNTIPTLPTNISAFNNDVGYLTTATIPDILGNLEVVDQTIYGTQVNADITLTPNGLGTVQVPSITLPVGSVMQDTTVLEIPIADLELAELVDYSTNSDPIAQYVYGNPNGLPAPWAVYRFTTTPDPVLVVGDIIGGAGIPVGSEIQYVGTDAYSAYIVTDLTIVAAPPVPGQTITIVRPLVNASLNISTLANVDIALQTGGGTGVIVSHSDIVPFETGLYSLGTPAKRFNQLWLSGASIFILDEVTGSDIALSASNGSLVVQASKGLKVGEFEFLDNTLTVTDLSRDIIVGQTTATGKVVFNRAIDVVTETGSTSFSVGRDGLTTISTPVLLDPTKAVLSIIGNIDRIQQPRILPGTLLHITGQDGVQARLAVDAFGTGAYPVVVGRAARGTAQSPAASQLGDVLLRMSGWGYGASEYVQSRGRINIVAAENFTNTAGGTKVVFQTTPVGSTTIGNSATIDDEGLSFVGTTNSLSGITFRDSTRQTTAFTGTVAAGNVTGLATVATSGSYTDLNNTPTNVSSFFNNVGYLYNTSTINVSNISGLSDVAVTKIVAGNGITVSTSTGEVGIDATGVQTTVGTANQVIVTDSGSKNLTLSLPQNINTTASVTFQNITVDNLTILGTSTVASTLSIEGKIIYLATSATDISQIDGGGIQLGTSTFAKSILYSNTNNWWDTDGSGLKTQELTASTATVDTIYVLGHAHFGSAYNDYEFSNAQMQADGNANSYLQQVIKNHNSGTNASSDIVAVNNLGDDSGYYIDTGINSSNYSNPDYSITGPNDGYLFINGGDLAVGTQSAGTEIRFHTGGTTIGDLRATITDAGLYVEGELAAATINGLTLPGTTSTAGYVLSNDGAGITSWVQPQTGFVGSRGTVGFTGSQGDQGVTGFTGSRGTDGVIGYNGSVGFTGSAGVGFTGSQGFPGFVGSQGNIGFTGSKGDTGAIGNTGVTGFTGSVGFTGSQGNIGFTGSQGSTGTTGATGFTGSQGVGFTGSQGTTGTTGFVGSQGTQGSPGYTGSQGTGYTGSQGTPGTSTVAITSIGVQGDGAFTATSTITNVIFAPGGRMVLNIATGSNIITITDNAKAHKTKKVKHKNGSFESDIIAISPEDTFIFEEGYGIILTSNTATQTVVITAENSIRDAGAVNAVTVDFATDETVIYAPTNTNAITLINAAPGRTVDVWAKCSTNKVITHGGLAANSSLGAATITPVAGSMVKITYLCTGATTASVYVSWVK